MAYVYNSPILLLGWLLMFFFVSSGQYEPNTDILTVYLILPYLIQIDEGYPLALGKSQNDFG